MCLSIFVDFKIYRWDFISEWHVRVQITYFKSRKIIMIYIKLIFKKKIRPPPCRRCVNRTALPAPPFSSVALASVFTNAAPRSRCIPLYHCLLGAHLCDVKRVRYALWRRNRDRSGSRPNSWVTTLEISGRPADKTIRIAMTLAPAAVAFVLYPLAYPHAYGFDVEHASHGL